MPRRRLLIYASMLLLVLILVTSAHAGVKFQPVSPEELKMTSEPLAPGAPAIILYREVYRDDCGITCHSPNVGVMSADRFEDDYIRIKILTEAGRKYGEVEIPLSNEVGAVDNINARTIRPDGSIVDFKGQVFEKTILKAKGLKYVAQTFAMPDVQVGSIIEYSYTIRFLKGLIYNSDWVLSQELFTKRAKFSLRPFTYESSYNPVSLHWNEHLPPGTPSPTQRVDGSVELEAANIAPFQTEDFMPPENELKARVDFIYSFDGFETDVNKFWKKVGKKRNDELEAFIGRRGVMEQAVSQIVSASDTPDVKLHKIYARVQQMRNTTFEARKTEQEQKREGKKKEESAEDIWKQGYGERWQLNWLCLALARAAGIEAYGVWVSNRSSHFFNPQSMQSGKLDESLVLVKADGKDVFLAPGAPFTPFGLLPWEETHVQGLKLDKDGGSWIQTSLPESSASRTERKADLKLSATGSLEGKLQLSFTGLEAQRRREDERNKDDTARKRFLEDQVKECIPVGSEVELTKQPDWSSSEAPLVAEFNLSIPGWATAAGRRAIFPVEIFGASERHVFDYSTRSHPIYFEFLAQKMDDVTIELPAGWQITGLPKPQSHDLHAVDYALLSENTSGALHMTRKLDINSLTIDQKYYPSLRAFFQMVRDGDEQPVVVEPGATAGGS
ncbi:MAG: DUF3857 domain-containing protein [Candidatus Sulfotelmatobacter sp.]